MDLKELTKKDFEKKVIQEKKSVVVKFTADWCMPCKMIEPHLKKLAKEYDGKVLFYEVDVEDEANSEIVTKFNIVNLPTLLIFKEGKVVSSLVGLLNYNSLKKELDNLFF
ncbi:MAG: thioredoxin [Caldisericia bacterium]